MTAFRFPALLLALCAAASGGGGPVLIVADEFPAMQALAEKLKAAEGIDGTLVKQTEMPAELGAFPAVIVYIHGDLREQAERKLIDYANGGGRLILLHHSISSGKRKNQLWIPFVGVTLPFGEFADGGYRWIDPVTMEIVNLAPGEFITTHKVEWEGKTAYASADLGGGEKEYPSFTLHDTEVYLNHVFTGPHTILLGLKYRDAKTGKTYMQDRAGWYKRAGKGWVLYFMPGHSVNEFSHATYLRIVLNAVIAPLPQAPGLALR